MQMDEIIGRLSPIEQRLHVDNGVTGLYVFGSVARGTAGSESDVDILVDFRNPPTFSSFMDLKFLLEDTLGRQVDLVTRSALRPSMRPEIEAEAKRVA